MTIIQNGSNLVVIGFPNQAIPKDFSQKLSPIGILSNMKNGSSETTSFTITIHENVKVEKAREELEEYEKIYNESFRA